jgi:hypothetical protein
MTERLRLKAEDADDLVVISACLQDALVPVEDMAFLPEEARFAMVVNRFVWEGDHCARTTTGIGFEGITAVRRLNLDPTEADRLLSLLAITAEPGAIHLEFSRGAALRLETDRIACFLQDLDDPWPAMWRPAHE